MSNDVPALVQRIRFAREAFDVERCHTHPHLLRYSVGHHSAGVASLVIQTWLSAWAELPRAELITAALYHDGAELVTGDLPSPTKTLLDGALDKVEERVGYFLCDHAATLEPQEQEWLEAADAVELFLWCLEEVFMRGNRTFIGWVHYYLDSWRLNPLPEPFDKVCDDAWLKHSSLNPDARLLWSQLKEIAGL